MNEPMEVTHTTMRVGTVESKRSLLPVMKHWQVLAIFFVAALVLMWRLGKGSLDDWDEAIYAQVSKEAVEGGHWWTLHWGFIPFFEKPPLFMWATAILFEVFGVSEFWARAASAFSGVALLIVVYLIAKQIYDSSVGLIAAAILLTSYQYVASSRFGTTDVMLTLFSYLAIYAYLRLRSGGEKWWYLIWASCALALMTKSAAGIFALAAILLTLLFDNRLKTAMRSRHFWFGLGVALLIVLPWHLSMYLQHGQAFINQYIGRSVVKRSISVLDQHTGDRYYYIDRLQKYFFPWAYVAPFAIAVTVKEILQGRSKAKILMLMLALVFGICTAMQTKLRWYILPLYPALAILISSLLADALKRYKATAISCLAVAVFVVALLAPLIIVLLFGVAGIAVILLALSMKKSAYQFAAAVMCAFLFVAGMRTLKPLYEGGETPVAKLARAAGGANYKNLTPLVISGDLFQPAPLFYSNRPIEIAYNLDELARLVKEQQPRDMIMTVKDVETLSATYRIRVLQEAAPLVYATISPLGKP